MRFVVLALAALAFTAAPAQAKSCPKFRVPSGYINLLTVKQTGCSTGHTVAKAFYSCRRKAGLKGHCNRTVKGYACKETKRESIPTEVDGFVTCKRGGKQVKLAYQLNNS